ncbi:MAG TPA: hypothetical protein VG142_10625 [Trebonia sp.]|jgi:hypothetical protein|nr:hypothetical protein [Trebonia sp.]
MSEFSLPPLAVGYDSRWVHVPLTGDLDEWAKQATANYAATHGGNKRQIRALLAGAGEIARRAKDAVLALVLIPVAADGVRALVRFCPVDMSAVREDDDSWSALIGDLTPDSPWEEDAEVTEITTKAGPCRRIVRRTVEGEGNTRAITENVAYAWLFPEYAAGICMTTAFVSLSEAVRWRSALDELAAAVELEPAA